jgi:hypothetical protein
MHAVHDRTCALASTSLAEGARSSHLLAVVGDPEGGGGGGDCAAAVRVLC